MNKININQISRGDSVRTHDGIAYVCRISKSSADSFLISLLFDSRRDMDSDLRYSKDGTCHDSEIFTIEEIKAANQKLSVLENNALLTQLKHAIMKIPTRIEPIGGQNYKYIRLEEVLDTLQK